MVNLEKSTFELKMTYSAARAKINRNDLMGIWLMLMVRDDEFTVRVSA